MILSISLFVLTLIELLGILIYRYRGKHKQLGEDRYGINKIHKRNTNKKS